MILAETTVVIGFLRAPTARLGKIIHDHQAAICGVTLAEVYAGGRTAADFAHYTTVLALFATVPVPVDIWPGLGHNLSMLQSHGITVPFADALIATVAIDAGLELWIKDHHFPMMQTVLPKLRLFHEPP
jgi:predicted nucleic acid-binding protein